MGSAMTAVITRAFDELELATLDFGVEGLKGLAEEKDPLDYTELCQNRLR